MILVSLKKNEGVYVNVFGYDGIYPLRHTKQENAIDLLLISKDGKKHYSYDLKMTCCST